METKEIKDNNVELILQLGDIIQIENPVNEMLHEQTFIIDYIDKSKTYLINTDTLHKIKLNIDNNGILGDGHIRKISILSRADTPGYATQNGLVSGKWINIYFGGDYPVIITGEITNLEKDMIEIKTTDKDVIYINFDYKGIPEDLPIDNIEIREKPSTPLHVAEDIIDEGIVDEGIPELEEDRKLVPIQEVNVAVSTKEVKDQLREFMVRADQIVFGDEELGPVVQYIDISGKSQRYSIETQVTDLLDELLSTIPDTERTPRVLNNIHITIERFKQLREHFSFFDQYGNVEGILIKEATYKPLHTWLRKFNKNLYWILPIVKNIKKIYDMDNEVDEENADVINLNFSEDIKQMSDIMNSYHSNTLPAETNKYSVLYSELNNYFTPFNLIDDENQDGIIVEKEVESNINVVIDNLEDMYSSVISNNALRNKRFVISRYNLGESKLEATQFTGANMTAIRVPMTNNDLMSIKSIMTLPESTIQFSKINLPGTDILSKANLNSIFLNYWQLLKNQTSVYNTFIDTLDVEIEFDENTFVNGIRNFVFNVSDENLKGRTKLQAYNDYVNAIVPKTRVIFNLMKKYIKGKLSIIDVVSYLEPFMIYTDDLTFKQYQEITQFIDLKISEYNKNMIEMSRIFKIISTVKTMPLLKSQAFSIIDIISNNARYDIFDTGYNIENLESHTNSELLKRLTLKDCSKLYTSRIAIENLKLMFSQDIDSILESEQKNNDAKLKEEEKSDKCDTIIISKLYFSIDQLNQDNDQIIYFDKTYDKTNYGVMEEDGKRGGYAEQVINLPPEKLKQYIINDQMKKNRLSEAQATYLAETLIDGVKRVVDGQYAILYKSNHNENEIKDHSDYYVRKNNKWVIDKEVNKGLITEQSSILCDLQEKCISTTDDTCESMATAELNIQNELLKNIMTEFDSKYKMSKEEFEKSMKQQYEYFMSIMPIVSKIETNTMLKYNNQRFKIGMNVDENQDTPTVTSPFSPLLDIILSQSDFSKKQTDIIKFCDKFTRPYIPGFFFNGKMETEYWFYCIKTGVPLMPTFKKELASAFVTSEYAYKTQLETVKSRIGQISDDGDWWTDKNTGWPICPGDFDTDEGYDDGFKTTSKAVMEDDIGSKINVGTTNQVIKYVTPETIMINNITNTLSVAMGINIEMQKEFIINAVIETIKSSVDNESDYKEKAKKMASQTGKSMPSYKDFFNTSLLYYTLGLYLIAVQTSIPSIKTRKTHPGCVRSFAGYPFDGQSDLSSITYLACVVYDIRSSGEPWNVLKKTNADKIQAKIKTALDNELIQLPEVQRKFAEKTEYLMTSLPSDIPAEHDISKWLDFLPPLVPFKIRHLSNISDEFKRSLVNDLKNGSERQREKMLVVESKIIQFSLAIQERIQEIVKKHKVLLHTANNEPYLENACCDSKENEATIRYFTNKDKDIIEFNNIVERLNNMLDDINANTNATLFYSDINTKNIYPPISNSFNEKTIYMAFIFYCKFKSLLPIPDDLLAICTNKPDHGLVDSGDSIDRIIQKLKEDGRNYTNQQFLRLIQLVSRENIVHIELDNPVISCVTTLTKLLEAIHEENNEHEIVEQSLRDLIIGAIDTFDIASEKTTKQVIQLNNFLARSNESMIDEISKFVITHGNMSLSTRTIKKFVKSIQNIATWSYDESSRVDDNKISNERMYNVVHFYKTFIDNFINIFPNIILNKVNYENTLIPKYYGFSKNHANKIKNSISTYFENLKPFYGIRSLTAILSTIQIIGKNTVNIAKSTPCFSNIKIGDKILKGVIDEDTSRDLFQYYLLRVLVAYIDLASRDDMLVSTTNIETVDNVDLFTVDYIDERDTRIELDRNTSKVLSGNKSELNKKIAELLNAYMEIFVNEKDTIDITYEDIQDRIFKLKEKEKDRITDKLKALTDEARQVDTILKITKQGEYSKGLQKGLTVLDKNFYDEEQEFRDEMEKAERKIRQKNKDANDENIDILLDEYMEQRQNEIGINDDAYDMEFLNENYDDGYFDGTGAPEEEYDDYADFDS